MKTFKTINPATGEELQEYTLMSKEEALGIAKEVSAAQKKWKVIGLSERIGYFKKLAQVLRDNAEEYATIMTKEMGKAIKESRGEVEKCAGLIDVLIKKSPEWLKEEEVEAGGEKHLITFEPLGVVYVVMPWNFPFWQPFKVALPPLFSGNGVILKHARNVTGSSLIIEDAFKKAGFPEHVFRSVVIDHATSAALVECEEVDACSLTGSEYAGSVFAQQAGKALKKVVLELGGSDPLIVLDDADIEVAAKGARIARMYNAGQVCIAAKRIIVEEKISEAFIKKYGEVVSELKVGDPLDEKTDVGPLVNEKAVKEMEAFVKEAVEKGAEIVTGGKRKEGPGAYFEPTVLCNITEDMNVACKEVFGPIAPVIVAKDEEDAIRIANDTPFGLSGSVWTKDLERGERVARQIETGGMFVNSMAKSHPLIPLGGVKRSGFGNELSKHGMMEFVNIKSINMYEHK